MIKHYDNDLTSQVFWAGATFGIVNTSLVLGVLFLLMVIFS